MDHTEDILSGLNEEQLLAVTHTCGPLLIIAGAGTGKTTVITRRIAHLIQSGTDPGSILALTFTEKAAQEMEERVDRLVPYGYTNVHISTFHSFGDRVLRDNALSLGMVPDFRILSEAECIILLKEHLFDLPLEYYRPSGNPTRYLSSLVRFIGRLKDEDVSPEDYLNFCKRLEENRKDYIERFGDERTFEDYLSQQRELALTYARYQELLTRYGYLDYGDQILLTLKLFRTRATVLRHYQRRFQHILADEFQDTNYAQFELLKLLAGGHRNITVVADDDQSIYKFRGAAVSNVINFQKVYPDCKLITLRTNYRSVQPILDSAYRLITHNNPERLEVKSGIDKRLISTVEPEGQWCGVQHIHFDTLAKEADFVAETIYERVRERRARFRDFAILVRANSDAEPYLRALEHWHIPYRFSGNQGLYLREEVRLLVSLLRAITDYSDNVSLFHLARSRVYGLGAGDLIECNTLSRRRHRPLFSILRDVAQGEVVLKVSEEGLLTIRRLVSDIERFGQMAMDEPAGRVLYTFLMDTGYLKGLMDEDSERAHEEIQNISRFFEIITHLEDTLHIKKAALIVEHLNLLMEAGDSPGTAEPDPDSDFVHVLTVHKAKGLEFAVVFMVGLVADRFPRRERKDAIEVPEELIKDILPSGDFHLQEERRLFYVGMTRAKEELFLTSASDYGGVRAKKVSRFVLEAVDKPKALSVKVHPLETLKVMAGGRSTEPLECTSPGNGPISLSYYQVDDYLTCPLKYKFVHILRIPLLPHHTIIYGKSVHDAISFFFRRRLEGYEPQEEEVLGVFRASWRGEGFVSKEHELMRFEEGIAGLKRFMERQSKGGIKPKVVERDFYVTLEDNILFRGRWDLIEERGEGAYIIDFKTSDVREQKKADRKTKESTQLLLYAFAYLRNFGELPAGCELHFFESGLIGRTSFDEKDMEKALSIIKGVAEGIKMEDFTPKPNYLNCNMCAFNSICSESGISSKSGTLRI